MEAGSAVCTINPELGDDLAGQFHRRLCEGIRDNLEANVLYLADDNLQVLLLSLDVAGLFEADYMGELRTAIEAATGVPARHIIITSTHTHDAPDTMGLLPDSVKNEPYLQRLVGWLAEVSGEAVAQARPARIGWAQGEAHVGFNRRLCWADGSHSMYGDATRPDFTGLEGPDDPSHTILFAVDEAGEPIAIVHANCGHATCIESSTFASADFPGEVRKLIRATLKPDLPVLYLQGASGDTSPWNEVGPQRRWNGEERAREVGALLAGETLRLMRLTTPVADPVFRHVFEDLTVDVRLPSAEELAAAEAIVAQGQEGAGRAPWILADAGVLRLQREFAADPREILPLHALRLGDLVILTNPCELYCQFGLDIKRRSPAPVTMVAQLTDGFSGYCPTVPALMGGGYSGSAIHWARLEPYAGYKIVEASARLAHELWRE
jgi:neutral ceramidase